MYVDVAERRRGSEFEGLQRHHGQELPIETRISRIYR